MGETPTEVQLRITEWLDPKEVFESQYGLVTALAWCEYEQERIAKIRPGICVKQSKGRIALCYPAEKQLGRLGR